MKLDYNKVALCQFYSLPFMPTSLKNIINHWLFKVLTGLGIFYLLFAYFAVNPIAKKAVPWAAKKYLDSQATVKAVHFNPWHNQLTIDGLILNNHSDELLAGFEQLFIDLEADGLFERAWKFKTLRLQAPQTQLIQKQEHLHNWSDLIAKLNASPKSSELENSLPRLIVQSLAIFEGQFIYQDQRQNELVTEKLEPIDLTLGGFSTLPNQQGKYHLAASLPEDKGTIEWQGDLSVNPLASTGKVDLVGLDLPNLLALIAQSVPVKMIQGEAGVSLSYAFNEKLAVSDTSAQTTQSPEQDTATVTAHSPIFALDLTAFTFNANQLEAELPSGATVLQKQLSLNVPEIKTTFGAGYSFSFLDASLQSDDLKLRSSQVDDLPLNLSQVQVKQVAYDSNENQLDVGSILLDQAALKAVRDQSGQIDWQSFFAMPDQPAVPLAETQTTPLEDTGIDHNSPEEELTRAKPFALTINDVHLNQWQLHWLDHTFVQPMSVTTPTLNTHFAVKFNDAVQQIKALQLSIEGIAMHSGKQALLKLNKTELESGLIDFKTRQLTLPKIQSKQLDLPIIYANKSLNWEGVFKQDVKSTTQQSVTKEVQTSEPWQWLIKEYQLTNSRILLTDASAPEPFKYNIEDLSLKVSHLSQALNQPLPVALNFKLASGGEVKVSGKVAPTPLKARLAVNLDQLNIKPFTHYLSQHAALQLDKGLINIAGDVVLNKQQQTSVEFNGGLQLNALAILEEESNTPFLNWEAMQGEDIALKLAPNSLSIGSVSFVKPVGKFLIAEDKSLNLTRVLREKKANTTQVENASTNQSTFPVRIDKVKIEAAELDFEDLSLWPQFGTHINTLNGVINGLSTDKESQAKLAFDGKVDQYGSARIEGQLRPFEPTLATDIRLHFKNLAMENLTPYSGKFAGRKIDSGKLDVDLKYLIKDKQLKGDNQVVIKKIQLGEKIESKDAADLPLDLAIAILEDSQGVIDLDLPVKGDLNDPEFDYSSVIWKAFTGLLTKVVTAPFKVLGKLLGSGDKALDHIAFDAGKAEITPPSAEILDALAQSLQRRPQLSLEVTPAYQLKEDTAAIKDQSVRDAVATKMQEQDSAQTLDGPINLSDPATQKAVKALHDKLTKKSLLKRLSDRFDELPPEYYQKALNELTEAVEVDENALIALATTRGEQVVKYMREQGVDPARMVLKESKVSDKNETAFAIDIGKKLSKPSMNETTSKGGAL